MLTKWIYFVPPKQLAYAARLVFDPTINHTLLDHKHSPKSLLCFIVSIPTRWRTASSIPRAHQRTYGLKQCGLFFILHLFASSLQTVEFQFDLGEEFGIELSLTREWSMVDGAVLSFQADVVGQFHACPLVWGRTSKLCSRRITFAWACRFNEFSVGTEYRLLAVQLLSLVNYLWKVYGQSTIEICLCWTYSNFKRLCVCSPTDGAIHHRLCLR